MQLACVGPLTGALADELEKGAARHSAGPNQPHEPSRRARLFVGGECDDGWVTTDRGRFSKDHPVASLDPWRHAKYSRSNLPPIERTATTGGLLHTDKWDRLQSWPTHPYSSSGFQGAGTVTERGRPLHSSANDATQVDAHAYAYACLDQSGTAGPAARTEFDVMHRHKTRRARLYLQK